MQKIKFIFVAIAAILSAGCTERFEISVDRVSVVRSEPSLVHSQPPEYGIENPSRGLTGKLRIDVSTELDIYSFEKKNDVNVWFDIKSCESKKEIIGWPEVYINGNDFSESPKTYKYSVFFNYKNRSGQDQFNYNLAEKPESLCVQFGAADMWMPFPAVLSNVVVIDKAEVIKVLEGAR